MCPCVRCSIESITIRRFNTSQHRYRHHCCSLHYITNNIDSLTGGRAEEVVGVTGCEGQLKRGLRKIITPIGEIVRAQNFGNMKYYKYIPVYILLMCVYCISGIPSTTAGVYSTIEGGRLWLSVDPRNNSAKSNLSSRAIYTCYFVRFSSYEIEITTPSNILESSSEQGPLCPL